MEGEAKKQPPSRMSSAEKVIVRLQVEFARLEAKLDTALSFRGDMRREFEEHKRYVDRELIKTIAEATAVEAGLKELEVRIRALEMTDNTHNNYFRSIGFFRDLIMGAAMALIGAGVFFQ